MWIQYILIFVMIGIAIYLVRSRPSARHLALRRLGVFIALALGVVVVLAPGALTYVANLLGIGRGADLLLYTTIVAFLLYVVADYKKSVEINRNHTKIARALALTEARLHDQLESSGANSTADTATGSSTPLNRGARAQ